MRALDTTPEAHARQTGIYTNMAAEARLASGLEETRLSRGILEDGIRSRHPEYSEGLVRLAHLRAWPGWGLFLLACPEAAEIEP